MDQVPKPRQDHAATTSIKPINSTRCHTSTYTDQDGKAAGLFRVANSKTQPSANDVARDPAVEPPSSVPGRFSSPGAVFHLWLTPAFWPPCTISASDMLGHTRFASPVDPSVSSSWPRVVMKPEAADPDETFQPAALDRPVFNAELDWSQHTSSRRPFASRLTHVRATPAFVLLLPTRRRHRGLLFFALRCCRSSAAAVPLTATMAVKQSSSVVISVPT